MKNNFQKLILALLVSVIICACKKDNSTENSSENSLENAKNWYLKENAKSTTALSSGNGSEKSISREVLWDKANLYTLEDGTEIVGAPLVIKFDDEHSLKGSSLLLISKENGVYQSKIAHNDKTDHFSSAILKKEIGELYQNIPIKKVETGGRAKVASSKDKQMGGGGHQPGARVIDWYLETTFYDGAGRVLFTTREYLYTEYIEEGDPQHEGTPGVIKRTQEIKTDSLALTNPCMVKLILNKLLQNGTYSKMLQPFQSIILPNGVRLQTSGLPNLSFAASSQVYGAGGNYMLGHTGPMFSGVSSKIHFNSSAISNASQLFLQLAAIHEVAHAYSRYYIKAGAYGYPVDTTRYSTWAMNIANFELASKGINGGYANFIDHSLFLENYVDNFVKILKDMNGTAYTDKQYQMAAIYGLDNPGDEPSGPHIVNGVNLYTLNKSILAKSFNNLVTKFGITAAEKNSFYADNLVNVPANKKLPTNCP